MPSQPSDRRRSPRIDILGRMHGRVVSLGLQVTVIEMSLGGLSMESPVAFTVGDVHQFSLTLGDETAAEMRGRVVYCREITDAAGATVFLTGVQFIDDETEGPDVGDLIDKLK